MSQSSYRDFLPSLPGYKIQNRPSTQSPVRKQQTLYKMDGFPFIKDDESITSYSMDSVASPGTSLNLAPRTASPTGKKLMKQSSGLTLTFQAYFQEMALHTRLETWRIRRVVIFYYEDDHAIMIVERPQSNSGMKQGTLLKRIVPTKPDGSVYTAEDFYVGGQVTIFGITYNIVDADRATRNYQADDTPPSPIPRDDFEEQRRSLHSSSKKEWGAHHTRKNELKKFIEARLGNTVDNKGREGFLNYGSSVLKFLCQWDDTNNLYGEINEYTLTYYLSDDTIEIFLIPQVNSGRDQFTRLLRRCRLPKVFISGSYTSDLSIASNAEPESSYHWTDLSIGNEIFVYGRNLVIVDADQSTRKFYRDQNCELSEGIRQSTTKSQKVQREVPPYNGFGSEEDSLQSCVGPLSTRSPPKKRSGESKDLTYVAELNSGSPEDAGRRFVITFYLVDGTIKVHEIPARNSGFVGGVFLSRSKVKGRDGEFLTEKDMFLGSKIMLHKHVFHIIETNENTLRWMEVHRDSLPRANYTNIINKLRYSSSLTEDSNGGILLSKLEARDRSGSGRIDKNGLKAVLSEYGLIGEEEDQLLDHEVIVLIRALSNRNTSFEYKKLISELNAPTAEDDLYSL